jgi:hypothetical protein
MDTQKKSEETAARRWEPLEPDRARQTVGSGDGAREPKAVWVVDEQGELRMAWRVGSLEAAPSTPYVAPGAQAA